MPEGIPPANGDLVFEATLELSDVHDIGETQYGHRRQLDIQGGAVKGPQIDATVLEGGLDYELTLSNGALEIEQLNMLRTRDGALIFFRSCGTAPTPDSPVRMVPDIEAPKSGAYAFLNTGRFVGTRELDAAQKTMKLAVYAVTGTTAQAPSIAIENPSGVPDQTWECKKNAGQKGAEVYTESVGIGGSLAVGASKRGTRNVIPITGGTTTGRVTGRVLAGGADYQIIDASFIIDARYTLETADGELIIVRNCGAGGALVPVFEAKKDGKYAWLNEDRWLSSDPGVATNAVNLTIYEQK